METTLFAAAAAVGSALLLPPRMGAHPSPIASAAGVLSGVLIALLVAPTTPAALLATSALAAGIAVAVVTDLGEGYLYFAPIAGAIAVGLLGRVVGGVSDDETGTWFSLVVAVGAVLLYAAGRLFGRLRPIPLDPDSGEPMEAYGLFDTLLWLMVAATLPGIVAVSAFVLSAGANGLASLALFGLRAAGRPTPIGLPQAPFMAGAIIAALLWITL